MIGPGDRHAGQRGAGDPYAGMLHDAGKLRVPTTVLRKEEPAWRPVPADEEVPQRASYRHQPQGDPGTHEPDQDRRRPGARAELYSGNTQHAPNMELPPKPRKDNYQRPERRFHAPWRQPALITERHPVPAEDTRACTGPAGANRSMTCPGPSYAGPSCAAAAQPSRDNRGDSVLNVGCPCWLPGAGHGQLCRRRQGSGGGNKNRSKTARPRPARRSANPVWLSRGVGSVKRW